MKKLCVILSMIIITILISCSNESTPLLPISPITDTQLEKLMRDYNKNKFSLQELNKILNDSLNYDVVYNWALENTKKNNSTAEFLLARCYDYGTGTAQDKIKAEKYYLAAAEKNYVPAMCYLAWFYYKKRCYHY